MAQETEHSWDRQPGEPTNAYKAFCVFRDLPYQDPPRRRSRAETSAFLGKHNRPVINGYARKWNWDERARDYDNELQHVELDKRKTDIKQALERHLQYSKALQTKAIKALQELPQEVMSARNVLDYLIQGVEMERRALQEIVEGLGGAVVTRGKGSILGDMTEPEESTMMQLVRSLEIAHRTKNGDKK